MIRSPWQENIWRSTPAPGTRHHRFPTSCARCTARKTVSHARDRRPPQSGAGHSRAALSVLLAPMVPAVVLTVLLLQLLYVAGRMAIVPVLAAFALAYLLDPFVERLERRGLSRTVASLAAMLLVGLTGLVFLVAA
jgi:hypothetical protein